MSSNVNDRTMHEIYLHPFLRSVQADVASGESDRRERSRKLWLIFFLLLSLFLTVMCSYNQINGSWACQSE